MTPPAPPQTDRALVAYAHRQELRQELKQAGARRAELLRALNEVMSEIATLVVDGYALSIPLGTLAECSGVSRPTVYSMLDRRSVRTDRIPPS